jgi:Arc/MetJ family transcription regulator
MRRTNVILDEALLEEATRLSGERTYSATINRALQEMVRLKKLEAGLKILGGSNAWEGNLEEMRRGRDLNVDWPEGGSVIRDAPALKRRGKRRRGPR